MSIPDRELHIIRLVNEFGQASTAQILALVFPRAKSRTSADRVLRRLVRDGYLDRVERRRSIGGARGGSGEYVYSLGSSGWRLCKRAGRYSRKAIDYHKLAILDVYIRLWIAHQATEIELSSYLPEPECWRGDLQPDLTAIFTPRSPIREREAWFEVDLNSERPARINEKLARYVRAFQSGELAPSIRIVFVSPDDDRAREIRGLIDRLDPSVSTLFRSFTLLSFLHGITA